MPAPILRGLCWAFLVLPLIGCQTTGIPNPVAMFDDGIPDEGQLIAQVEAPASLPDPQTANTLRLTIEANSPGEAKLPNLQAYAQSVLDGLIAAAPVGAPPAEVALLANMSPGAAALPTGNIYVHHSIFNYVETEDQLAFLLAHEYGHVFMQHNPETVMATLRPYLVTAIDVAMELSDSTGSSKLREEVKLYGTDIVTRDLLVPIWDRKYERQADIFGIDLMVRAGYNPGEAVRFLDILARYESSFELLHDVERNKLEKSLQALSGKDDTQQNNPMAAIFSKLGEAFSQLQAQLARRHDDPQERIDLAFDYIDREHLTAMGAPLRTESLLAVIAKESRVLDAYTQAFSLNRDLNNGGKPDSRMERLARSIVSEGLSDHPYTRRAFARLRAAQGKYDLALRNYEFIEPAGEFLPLSYELDKLDWELAAGKKTDHLQRLLKLGAHYDWPLGVYRRAIVTAQKEGPKSKATELQLSCVAKYPQQRELCSGAEPGA